MKLFERPKRNWKHCCWNILWAHCLRRRKDCSKLYHLVMWMPVMNCSWLSEGRQAWEPGRHRKIWFCSRVSNPFCCCPTFHCPPSYPCPFLIPVHDTQNIPASQWQDDIRDATCLPGTWGLAHSEDEQPPALHEQAEKTPASSQTK